MLDGSIVTKSSAFIKNLVNGLSEYSLAISTYTIYELKLLIGNKTIYAKSATLILEMIEKKTIKEADCIDNVTTLSFSVFSQPHIFLTFAKLLFIEMLDSYYIKNATAMLVVDDIYSIDLSLCCNLIQRNALRSELFPRQTNTMEEKTIITHANSNYTPVCSGAEGLIYSINNVIYKRFKTTSALKKEKLNRLKKLPDLKHIVLPINIHLKNDVVLGYTMDKIDGVSLSEAMSEDNAYFRIVQNINKIIESLLTAILLCTLNEVVISDLSLENIMIDKDSNIYIVDADSFQVDGVFSECFQPQYATKELMSEYIVNGNCLNSYIRSYTCDSFAALIIIFQLITGIYPLHNNHNEYKDINFINNTFILKASPLAYKGFPDEAVYKWNNLPPKLKKLFIDVFTSGKGCSIGTIIAYLN